MEKTIRIGTRASDLAVWQAKTVSDQLEYLGYKTTIIEIDSLGDLVLDKPLYQLGVTGVFTRNLDVAMLNGEIDIAVHSAKDVPTVLPEKIVQAAVLKRGDEKDILVFKKNQEFFSEETAVVATGSLRRKAQWLNRYPNHTVVGLRGNVNTRLKKLKTNDWNGAIFAAAGLNRLDLTPENHINLSWMIPAPAQGVVLVTALADDSFSLEACEKINHKETEICATIERDFLNLLEGGCTAPIGALAYIHHEKETVVFKGVLLSQDGKQKIDVTKETKLGYEHTIARYCVGEIFEKGGKGILLRNEGVLSKTHQVFSTKKLLESQKQLIDSSIQFEDSDFIRIRFNRIPPLVVKNEIENVLITSQNAVESLLTSFTSDELQFKNIYCVGRRTKRLIEKKIGKVSHVEKDAAKLAEYLVQNLKGEEVTFFCSDKRLDELPNTLAENNISLQEVQVYKTLFSAQKLTDDIRGVLFFSPSAVQSFLLENSADKIAFCIGETTANEARKHFKEVIIADVSTAESVVKSVNTYYNNI